MRKLGVVIALLLAAGCHEARDDGFPEALLRGCTGEQACWEQKKQIVFHQDACAERRLAPEECQRLDQAIARIAANEATAAQRRADERHGRDEQKRLDHEEAVTKEERAHEAALWAQLDLVACREGDDDACRPVAEYAARYRGTPNGRDAENALDQGREVRVAKRVADRAAMEARAKAEAEAADRREAAAQAAEAARQRSQERPSEGGGARCCDGSPLSARCMSGSGRGCCSRHGGVCSN